MRRSAPTSRCRASYYSSVSFHPWPPPDLSACARRPCPQIARRGRRVRGEARHAPLLPRHDDDDLGLAHRPDRVVRACLRARLAVYETQIWSLAGKFRVPNFYHSFNSKLARRVDDFRTQRPHGQAMPPNGHALVRRTRSLSGTEADQNDLVPARSSAGRHAPRRRNEAAGRLASDGSARLRARTSGPFCRGCSGYPNAYGHYGPRADR